MSGQGRIYTRRGKFWSYAIRAAAQSRHADRGDLSPYDIDKLFVDQGWCCAVSGIAFDAPEPQRMPFAPSLDRIIAGGPYVMGNVRLVCNIVNFAMNEWGEDALMTLISRMSKLGKIRGVTANG